MVDPKGNVSDKMLVLGLAATLVVHSAEKTADAMAVELVVNLVLKWVDWMAAWRVDSLDDLTAAEMAEKLAAEKVER